MRTTSLTKMNGQNIKPYKSRVKHLSNDQQLEHIIKGLIASAKHYYIMEQGIKDICNDSGAMDQAADFEWGIYEICGIADDDIGPGKEDLIDSDEILWKILTKLMADKTQTVDQIYNTYTHIETGYRMQGEIRERKLTDKILTRTIRNMISTDRFYHKIKNILLTANSDNEIYSNSGSPSHEVVIDMIDIMFPNHIKTSVDQERLFSDLLNLHTLVTEPKELGYTSKQQELLVASFIKTLKK